MNEGREIYYSTELEAELLASLLKNNNNIDFADFLQDKHFYYRVNGFIYSAIKVIINKGLVADVTLVSDYLKGNKEVEAAGGKSYLTDIAKAVNMAPIAKIAKLIKLYHVKREAKNIITESLESLESDSVIDIEDRISNIESKEALSPEWQLATGK